MGLKEVLQSLDGHQIVLAWEKSKNRDSEVPNLPDTVDRLERLVQDYPVFQILAEHFGESMRLYAAEEPEADEAYIECTGEAAMLGILVVGAALQEFAEQESLKQMFDAGPAATSSQD